MRTILTAVVIAIALSGCTSGVATIQSLGDCTSEGFNDDGEEDWTGEYFLCEGVVGAGVYIESITCDFGGMAGAELQHGPANGTVEIRMEENGTVAWNQTIGHDGEAWRFIQGNQTVRLIVETSRDFRGTVAFGWGCYE